MAEDDRNPPTSAAQDHKPTALTISADLDARTLVVPDGIGLLTAGFERRGPDLTLTPADGPSLVILDYFANASPPDLVTPGGGLLAARVVSKLAGPDLVDAPAAGETGAAEPIGHVEMLEGEVTIVRLDGSELIATAGTPVFQDDVVVTADGGAVGLRFVDDMTLSLGSDARLVLDEFAYDPAANTGGGILEVIQGAFSFVSGKAAHVGLDSLVIDTPTMTIGIRGTKVVAQAAAEGETTTVVLLPEDDGTIGKINITTDAGAELLQDPFVGTTVTSRYLAPAPQSPVSPEWVFAKFSQPLAYLPPEQPQAEPAQRGNAGADDLSDGVANAEDEALGESEPGLDWGQAASAKAAGDATLDPAALGGEAGGRSAPVSSDDPAGEQAAPDPTQAPPPAPLSGRQGPDDDGATAAPAPPGNAAPTVVAPIADTAGAEDAAFRYDLAGAFTDADGEPLTFTAETTAGTPLPVWLGLDPTTGMLSGTPGNADVGTVAVKAVATDAAGASAETTFELTVTNTNDAPVTIAPIADSDHIEDAAFSYDAAPSFADDDTIHGDSLSFSAEAAGSAALPAWLTIDPATGVLAGTPTNADVGIVTIDVTATDGAGATAVNSFQLAVANTNDAPVVVTPIANTGTAEDAAFSYDVATNFADVDGIHGDTLAFSAELSGGAPLPAWLAIDPATGVLSGTPANADVGGLTVEVTATDVTGASALSSFQLTVSNSNDAPVVVTPIADTATAEDAAFSYDAAPSFADADTIHGDSLAFSAELAGGVPLPAWLGIDAATGLLSGIPANGDVGVLDVEVTATDGAGATAMSAFQLTITNSNDAPVVVTPIVATATAEDAGFAYDVSSSFADADTIHGDSLAFTAELAGGVPLPAWLGIDAATGLLSGIPANGDVGVLDVEVTATDGAGATAMSAFQLTITNSNDAPVVVTPIVATATAEDAGFAYDVSSSFADADTIHGDSLAFSAELAGGVPLPAWLGIDAATGLLSGIPANGDVGVLDVEVTATDGAGATAMSAFQLTITNSNDAPVVVTPIVATATAEDAGFAYDVSSSFADADTIHGDSLAFTAELAGGVPLPAWLAIDAATGLLSGIPANGDVGVLTVEVTATDGSGATAMSSFDLTVTNTNDAPVLDDTAAPTLTAVPTDATDPSGDAVADIVVDGSITDVDGPAVEAIAVTGVDDSNGSWEYSTDGGNVWSAVGAVTDSAALLLNASGRLRFVPDPGFQGNATFTFRAWDQTVGSSGELVDASVNGGTTSYSATSDTASVAVEATELNLSSGSEFQVNTTTVEAQKAPAIAALSDGGYVVTWQSKDQDGDVEGIFGQRFDSGGNPTGTEFQINSYITDEQQAPSVAGLDGGGFVVAWQSTDQDGAGEGLYGQRFDTAGNPTGAEFQINSYSASDQQSPSLAALDDGGFVVTWQSWAQDGNQWGVYGQRFDAAGVAVGAEFQVNTVTANEQRDPSVAALEGGGFVVTWQSWNQDGNQSGVYGQRFDAAGNPAGTEFQINTYTAGQQQAPSVAGLTDGGFVVTWQSWDQDGHEWGVYGQRFDAAGNPVEFEFQVNTEFNKHQQDPTVIGLSDGGFLVSWQSRDQDGDNWGIYGQRYNADGDAVGSEFQLNTETIADQHDPALAVLADGDLVAAWESNNQDGSQEGVFGHHYQNETASVTVNPPQATAASTLDFAGTSSYVDVGDPGVSANALDPGAGDFTVEAWFYYAGPNGTQSIVSKGNATEWDPGFNIFLDGNQLVVRANSDWVGVDSAAAKVTLSGAPGWHHVAMVLDQEAGAMATTIKGYLDGSEAGWTAGHGATPNNSLTTELGVVATGDRFLIGAVYDAGVAIDHFGAEIADVRVWNTARDQADIQADLGRTLDGKEDHLIANWRLDDGGGASALDSGPDGYDGALGGGPAWNDATDFTILQDTTLAGRISASDAEGDALSYAVASGAANGTATIDTQDGTWSYTPNAGYTGSDGFSYQVSDGNGGTDTVNVSVAVTP